MMMGIITAIILWVSGTTFNSTSPQLTAQQPTYQFRSTSQMQPASTSWGEKRTYTQPFSADAPGTSSSPRHARRAIDPEDEGENPGYNQNDGPIGDIPWMMMLFLAGVYIVYATRKRQHSQIQ